jgi:hypothetical protein
MIWGELFISIIVSFAIVLLVIDLDAQKKFLKDNLILKQKNLTFLFDAGGELMAKKFNVFYWVLLSCVFLISVSVFYKNKDVAFLLIAIMICKKIIRKMKG